MPRVFQVAEVVDTRRLEVVATTLADVVAARDGGADRVELAGSHTALGATTPSLGFMQAARNAAPDIELFAMIRPRTGTFSYEPAEMAQMEIDISASRTAGLDGVMIGVATPDRKLDQTGMVRLFDAAFGLRVCINMAFDHWDDPLLAMDWLVEDGRTERVLTAGGGQTAIDGLQRIAELAAHAGTRLTVMPGTGLTCENLPLLLGAVPSVREVHVSNGVRTLETPFGRVDEKLVASVRRLISSTG